MNQRDSQAARDAEGVAAMADRQSSEKLPEADPQSR